MVKLSFNTLFLRYALLGFLFCLYGCTGTQKKPDVSGMAIPLTTLRFEQSLFKADTNHILQAMDSLLHLYPRFGENFLYTILNVDPHWQGDTAAQYIKGFIQSYTPVYDTAEKIFADFTPYEKQIKEGMQYMKYYIPDYTLPSRIITYIGPLDGYGDILDENSIIVGLHQHLGSQYSGYQSEWVQQTYPQYITRRFTPQFISINAMKNLIDDRFPEKPADKSLAVQMVEKGKRLYLLQKLLPNTPEYNIIGYTEKQLADCYKHEASIWQLFVMNNLLQNTDNGTIKNYIGESPKTQELGEASPGNIGSFCGWQIVKKYMAENKKLEPKELMETDAEKIIEKAKYKP